ncbi:GAF domain-containing protein [Chamaesiphon sp.]|uniref:GAF domain-containing protein n=1 Tax=Chamaesiphon sp. TaxID=2814140 RepID=UPI0035943590
MNTIDRNDVEKIAPTTETPLLEPATDSVLWVSQAQVMTEMEPPNSSITVAPFEQKIQRRQQKSLQRQIFLMILPFIILPLGMGGWLGVSRLTKPSSPQMAQMARPDDGIWGTDLIVLLSIGFVNLGVAAWVSRRIANSIDLVTTKITEAANGDLGAQLGSIDTAGFEELSDSFNQLVANFNSTLQQQQLAAQANKLFGKIALTAQESVDKQQVYDAGVSGMRQILNVDRVSICLRNPDGSSIVVAESLGDPTLSASLGQIYFAETPGELARYQEGQCIVTADLQQLPTTPHHQDFIAKIQAKSAISMPILAGKQQLGLLSIYQCDRVRQWQSWEVSFCTQAAQRLSLAIEQIATWTTQAVELRRTNMLAQALQLNDPAEMTELLDRALETIRVEFNLDRVMVFGLNQHHAGQITSIAIKPGCLVPDEQVMSDYLHYEIEREGCLPEQISCIYSLDNTGGLKADEIALLENIQIRARLVAPIIVEGRVLGLVIGHICTEDRQWAQLDIDKFAVVADRIGLVLDRQQAIEQRATQLQNQNILSDITLKLRQSVDRAEIIATALTNIRTALGLDRAVFMNIGDNWQTTIAAESVAPKTLAILGTVIEDTCLQTTQGAGYDKGRITTIDDIYRSGLTDCHIQMLERLQVRANLVVPVLVNNKICGLIIGHMCHAPRIWEVATTELLAQIAIQISLVLNQAQLFAQRENEARKSQILSNFTLQLRQSLKRQDILTTAVELVRYALDLDRAVIFELDSDFNGKITAESVAPGKLSILDEQIDDCCLKDAGYEHGKITSYPDIYQAGLSECHIQMLENLQVRANLVVPITIDSHLFGLFMAHQCQAPRAWQPEEINLFNQLATQLALALNQASLIEQREAAAKRSQLVSEITLKLRQSIDESEILNIALPEIRAALGLDRASILVVDTNGEGEGEGKIIAESIAAAEFSIIGATVPAEDMFEVLGRGYKESTFIKVDNLQTSDFSERLIANLQKIQIKSIVTTPIIVNQKFFGLFSATMCDRSRIWEQSEVELLLQLAAQIGVALTQSQLVRQLELANLQQSGYAASQEAARKILQKNAWELLLQVDRISQGDLTIRAHVTEDEIGTIADSYNSTVESLRGLVGNVRNVSQEVVSTTTVNEISVAELSIEALQQSEEIGIALRRLHDMSGSIELVVNNALIAESAVMESAQLVQAGDAAMNLAVEGILTIRNTVAETAKKVKRLGESSQKISKVVNLISSFAAQTNLLALNASIEAARAGEEGRGFAVVAEEVRSLARQSAAATGEIENLVASIQAQTSEVVMAMEAGTEQVIIGTRLVDETRSSLNRITAISLKIGELVESIAQAALLQSENSTQVTQSIDRVANISHKTSTRADNVQASFQDLLQLAQELQKNVGQFKIE